MLEQDVKDYIDRSVLCWLATVDGDQPSVSPKEIFTYYGDDTIIIANIASPQSMKNISHNNKICVSFVDVFSQRGFQVYGVAQKSPLLSDMELAPDMELASNMDPAPDMDKDKLAILQKIAGELFPVKSFIDIKVTKVKPILAPSYRMFENVKEEDMIENAMKTYGVKRA
ncbi:pyridoxamine 5'-phosphate oxidase family protein [Alphaproteobacteria bacterium]|nr:pyridoxamine 5'-phosphate oxidase family protein [Alphaproteobacteria bacterium]